jgi:hypothetical protein
LTVRLAVPVLVSVNVRAGLVVPACCGANTIWLASTTRLPPMGTPLPTLAEGGVKLCDAGTASLLMVTLPFAVSPDELAGVRKQDVPAGTVEPHVLLAEAKPPETCTLEICRSAEPALRSSRNGFWYERLICG